MSTESGGHYYTRDGKSAHTQKCKPGAKNATRPTNVSDARKLGLLPSVTGVTGVLSSPALQRWREKQIIDACYNVGASHAETLEEYSDFIMERAFAQVKDAADLGSGGHNTLQDVFLGRAYDRDAVIVFPTTGQSVPSHVVIEPVKAAIAALNLTVKETECVVINQEHGFGGTLDVAWIANDYSSFGCWDYKFCKTKPGEPVKVKETQPMQIAAYVQTYWGGISEKARGFNVYISSTEPGRVELVHYGSERLRKEWEAFKHCLALWAWRNGYDPRQKEAA